jgi:hypothetical protein
MSNIQPGLRKFVAASAITASGTVAPLNTVTRVNTAAFVTAGGLLIDAPSPSNDGDSFLIIDEGSTFSVLNKNCVVRFGSAAVASTYKGAADDVDIDWADACVTFTKIGGTWRISSKA